MSILVMYSNFVCRDHLLIVTSTNLLMFRINLFRKMFRTNFGFIFRYLDKFYLQILNGKSFDSIVYKLWKLNFGTFNVKIVLFDTEQIAE